MSNYSVFHLHSDSSLLDSCTKYKDYIDKAVELGMTAIGFSEHGNIYNWIEKKMYCDKKGIKYIHGCEIYITESFENKVRDNMHTILIAKNMEGLKEINLIIDKSTKEDHFYYNNRISIEEFLQISNNVIKISACLGSPLNKLSEDSKYYKELLKAYDYYEIQHHNDKKGEQARYNKKLYELSKEFGKPLIVGTDTHSIDSYKAECRKILKLAKKMTYGDEDDYDLTFKSYDELVDMYKAQNSLPIDVIVEALENTNKMTDSCEDIILDPTVKYPIMSEDDETLFRRRVLNNYNEMVKNKIISDENNIYMDRLKEEVRVFRKLNMCSFMLFMGELCVWCKESGIPIGFCRGSVGGSLVAYILGIIDLDPIEWNTVFSRFCNEDRLEVGDIDLDFSPSQRELVYNYIIDRFGIDKSAYILAMGTISDKGTIDDIGRALEMPLSEVSNIKKIYENNQDEARKKYPKLFYYFDGLLGTTISQSVHPAGIIASPVTLPDNYGTFWKDGKRILQINMEEVHDGAGLVKYDILGLKNIEIIKDTCELIGIPYPSSKNIEWEDAEAWEHITDTNVGIFQFEGDYAYKLLKRFKPKKINDLSLVNASLRPSGESYRDRLINGEYNKNPSEIIDDLLKDNKGYLIFQEDTIAFLQKICGLSGSEADNIRRAIGRKQKDRLDKAMPSILEGYCNKSDKPREIAENEAKEFLQIIEDSSNYQFGFNHSTGYSMIGYLCGWLRHRYPIEFVTAYLNNAGNDDDIKDGTKLASVYNIKVLSPKFRYAKSKYFMDKATNSIYKGVGSIKYLNSIIAEELYDLGKNKYDNFVDLLLDIKTKTTCNSRQLDILIKLGYFEEFGKTQKLLNIVLYFGLLYKNKDISSPKIETLSNKIEDESIIRILRENSEPTEKTYKNLNVIKAIQEIWRVLKDDNISLVDRLAAEIEFLGYIDYKNEVLEKRYVLITSIDTRFTPTVDTYCLNNGNTCRLKIPKKVWNEIGGVFQGEVIYLNNVKKEFGWKPTGKEIQMKNGKTKPEFVQDETKLEWKIYDYTKVNIDEVLNDIE